jgi:hypothetical protein
MHSVSGLAHNGGISSSGVGCQLIFILYSSARPKVTLTVEKVHLSTCFLLEKTTFGLGLYIILFQIGGSDKEFIHIYLSQGVVFPSATYVRNLISKEVIKQVIV